MKLNNQVSFSSDTISLKSYLSEDYDIKTNGSPEYELYGIVCHHGSINCEIILIDKFK